MTMSPEFRDHLLDLLASLGPVAPRRMFGGSGLFLDGTMFGLIFNDVLYLKADAVNQPDFVDLGMDPFVYERKGKPIALSYWQAPSEILDDGESLSEWAGKAWEAARRTPKKPARRRKQ